MMQKAIETFLYGLLSFCPVVWLFVSHTHSCGEEAGAVRAAGMLSRRQGEPRRMQMPSDKNAVLAKMAEKGMSVADAAAAIGFDANLLRLYLVDDSYPVPTRIVKKLEEFLNG